MRKPLLALATAATIAAAALAPNTADARCRGCGVAAGVVGGLAVGTLLGSALAGPRVHYYEPAPVYVAPPPVYYGPICHIEKHRVWHPGYGYRWRRVEICD